MKKTSRPLRRLVAWRLALATLIAVLIQVALVIAEYWLERNALSSLVLEQQADLIADALHVEHGSVVFAPSPSLSAPYQNYPQNYAFQVLSASGSVLAQVNTRLHAADFGPLSGPTQETWSIRQTATGPVYVLSKLATTGGNDVLVRVLMAGDPAGLYRSALLHEVMEHIALPMGPLAALILIVNFLAVGQVLRPLERVAAAARAIDPRDARIRLAAIDLPLEVGSLVNAVNSAFARLEEAARFQQDFTATMAHELRTPLAILMLQLDEIGGPAATHAKTEVRAMARLVDQILRVSQLEALAITAFEPVSLASVAREVTMRMAPLALDAERHVELIDAGSGAVRGHREAIASALRNLIENAVRATPPYTTVRVTAGPGSRLSVEDSGPGIAADMQSKLFKRFTQGDQGIKGSAGLGLSIVQRIMDLHGGSVTLENKPEGGCHATLAFPEPKLSRIHVSTDSTGIHPPTPRKSAQRA